MSYPEFRELILKALEDKLPEDISVEIIATEKLNGYVRYGIMFKCFRTDYAPTIYLEPFFHSFEEGHTIEAVAEEVYRCYLEDTAPVPDVISALKDYDLAKVHIFARLVHRKENTKLLENTPHMCFLDFAVIPYFEVNTDQIFKGSVLIKNYMLEKWGVSGESLIQRALVNTKDSKGVLFLSMQSLMAELCQGIEKDSDISGREMYVLTNKEKFFGAVLVCFPEVLAMVYDHIRSDFYLLPSSVHEWVILPDTPDLNREEMVSMVQSINADVVMEEEVLSQEIYHYSASSQKIYVCKQINDKND